MRESGPHLAGDHGVHPQNIPDGRLEVGRAVVALQGRSRQQEAQEEREARGSERRRERRFFEEPAHGRDEAVIQRGLVHGLVSVIGFVEDLVHGAQEGDARLQLRLGVVGLGLRGDERYELALGGHVVGVGAAEDVPVEDDTDDSAR